MLSDEEREALRNFKSEYESCDHYSSDLIIELDDAETILNLIEKQSKEIEDYIENKELINQTLGLEKDSDINKTLEKIIILNNFEDKIKAKIEEVEQWELYNMKIPKLSTLDERLGAKIGIKYVLQSLLEKE